MESERMETEEVVIGVTEETSDIEEEIVKWHFWNSYYFDGGWPLWTGI